MENMNLKSMSTEDLKSLLDKITTEITSRNGNQYKVVSLAYNHYKGSGKCWIAKVDAETKKILGFLVAESVEKRGNYSGHKNFKVLLTENQCYLFCESGSKSTDSRKYFKVINGELVQY